MTIFEALIMAHVLGDFLLQTEWQAQNKKTHLRALLAHVSVYHLVVLVILYTGFSYSLVTLIPVVLVLAIAHAVLDGSPVVRGFIRLLKIAVHRDPERWLVLAVDQSLHLLLLGGAAIYLSRVPPI